MKKKEEILSFLNENSKNTLLKTLGIKFVDLGDDFLSATMSVDSVVHQPMGFLHGGASVALAESLGSCLSSIVVDNTKYTAVGVSITGNHLKIKKEGVVTGVAKLIRKGRNIHFSEIEIRDEDGGLICFVTMTNMIILKERE